MVFLVVVIIVLMLKGSLFILIWLLLLFVKIYNILLEGVILLILEIIYFLKDEILEINFIDVNVIFNVFFLILLKKVKIFFY